MKYKIGTNERPLTVGIIGSGPSGFYTAEALIKSGLHVEIDMLEYLPTPFGLVRAGVAPDHQKIKGVTNIYERIAASPQFRFWGNVNYGEDISYDEIKELFDIVVYAIGAQSDTKMNIPGIDLEGCYSATKFVAWYNGHPDYQDLDFDPEAESVTIIGMGNVALDIARILALSEEELNKTDIPHANIEKLAKSKIKEINIIARRGPMQAAFTPAGSREFPELQDAVTLTDPEGLQLEDNAQLILEQTNDKRIISNLKFLEDISKNKVEEDKVTINFIFRRSPVQANGKDRIESLDIVKNELFADETGKVHLSATRSIEQLKTDLLITSIGYRVKPVAGIPIDEKRGTIENSDGRVTENGEMREGEYVVGWAKRGANGIIGTNKSDSIATIDNLLYDVNSLEKELLPEPQELRVLKKLVDNGVHFVPFEDWQLIDSIEKSEGAQKEKPREKLVTVHDMIKVIAEEKLG